MNRAMPFRFSNHHPIKQEMRRNWSGRICENENNKKPKTLKTTNSES
jgi:hypothetical protein